MWFVAKGKADMAAMLTAHEIDLRYPAVCLRIVCPAGVI